MCIRDSLAPVLPQQREILHNVVMFTTLETPSELFPVAVSGLIQILPFWVLFGLLEELFEFSGDHGHVFFISLNVVLHSTLQPTTVLTIRIWWSSHGLDFMHVLWCTHLLRSLKVLAFKGEPLVRFESTKHKRGGELCFIKYCQIFANSRYACSDLSLIHIWRCRRIERCRSRWSPYH